MATKEQIIELMHADLNMGDIVMNCRSGHVVKIDARKRGTVLNRAKQVVSTFGGPYDRTEVVAQHAADWSGKLGAEYIAAHTANDNAEMKRIWRKIGCMW